MVNNIRDQFSPRRGIYLLNHSVGCPPVTVRQALEQEFFEPWKEGGEEVWPRWLQAIDGFCTALADLLHTDTHNICPQTNVSGAVAKIMGSLPKPKDRSVILLSECDFPSVGFVLSKAESLGYRLKFIPESADLLNPDVWAESLTDEVAWVLVTQVQSNTGCLVPAAEVVDLARSRGIISILDICQSVGIVPIELEEIRPDFAVGSSVKWLCGGPGAGFLWVDPEILPHCEPVDVGWFSHADPFEFDIHHFEYADSALRFWGGTPSVLPFVVAANSIRLLSGIGVERIREHNAKLTDKLANGIAPGALVAPDDSRQRGGTLVLNFGNQQAEVVAGLQRAGVLFDVRSKGIRLSPHIYNTAGEIQTVLDVVSGALNSQI